MAAIDAIVSSKTKYDHLINIARGILCQNLLLRIQLDVMAKILSHGFNITFSNEAILKMISCSCRFTMVHWQQFTGMAAASLWTGTLGNNSTPEVRAARPKGGLFIYHVKRIHFTMQGFGFLSAILVRQNWTRATTTDGEVPPSFKLARFDLNKDCCLKLFTNR